MRRVTLFAKANVDVHDSLHSCRIAGEVRWNGINELVREQRRDVLLRVRHETFTRSDAVAAATGAIPREIAERKLPLGSYASESQFATALFSATPDAFVLSMLSEIATPIVRHKRAGFLFYASDSEDWQPADREWLRAEFEPCPLPTVEQTIANLGAIVDRIRERSDAPILVYNVSAVVPGETVHFLQGLGETYSTRARRFNVGLADFAEASGVSVIDVDAIVGRAGADAFKIDAMRLTPEGYRLVAAEVLHVLEDLGVVPSAEERQCEPA